MSFLYPLYFLGALALAAPLLLHLRKRPPKDQTLFSSLMFLDKSPQKLTRRSKLEKLFLLFLRCLALLLLTLMFARPFFSQQSVVQEAGLGRRVVVLVDRSASMRRADLWDQAKKHLAEELEALRPEDEAAVMLFDDKDELLLGFEEWKQLAAADRPGRVMAKLGAAEAGWKTTALGESLGSAVELLADRDVADAVAGSFFAQQEVVLISDFQDGSERDSLNRLAWPEGVVLRNVQVSAGEGANFSLFVAGQKEEDEEKNVGALRVRVANSQQGQAEKFTLSWVGEGTAGEAKVAGNVPSGGARVLMAPPRFDESAAGILEVGGDAFDFDNRIYVAGKQARVVKILYLADQVSQAGAEDAGSALFYLSRALRKTATIDPQLEVRESGQVASVDELKAFDVVVVTGRWDAGLGTKLASFAGQTGGAVLCAVAADLAAKELEALTGLQGVGLTEAGEEDYAMLTDMDFSHPVLRPFVEAQVRDFGKIHFWRHRVLSMKQTEGLADHVTVMASYDDGSPAWLDVERGRGRVYLMMSGWQPQESQLALSSKFVPFLYSILNTAGFSAQKSKPVYVGDDLPVEGAVAVKRPGESELIDLEAGQKMFSDTDRPGFYEVLDEEDGGQVTKRIYAVNLSPSESRVDVFDADSLADFGIVISSKGQQSGQELDGEDSGRVAYRLESEEREGRQKIWKWIVMVVLLVLWLESWVAGRVGRRVIAA
ncbi:MAG: VWA domain-containing protein [Verrucomicrobiota bacterium]